MNGHLIPSHNFICELNAQRLRDNLLFYMACTHRYLNPSVRSSVRQLAASGSRQPTGEITLPLRSETYDVVAAHIS